MDGFSITVLDPRENCEGLLFESRSKSHNRTVTKGANLISDAVVAVGRELQQKVQANDETCSPDEN